MNAQQDISVSNRNESDALAQQDITVILLVGGLGTRIRAIHDNIPKAMIPICGQPFLHWLHRELNTHGLDDIVLSAGHQAQYIQQWADSQKIQYPNMQFTTIIEPEKLGTAGGVLHCLNHYPNARDWILVMNGDSLCVGALQSLLAHDDNDEDVILTAIYRDDARRFGALDINEDGYLRHFQEKAKDSGYINSGIYLFKKTLLQQYQYHAGYLSMEDDFLPKLLEMRQKIKVKQCENAPFIDIGTPESLAQAENFIKEYYISET